MVSVTINTFEFLLFPVYMPCDEQRAGANLNEFIDVLNEIHSICLNSECQFFVIGGDLIFVNLLSREIYLFALTTMFLMFPIPIVRMILFQF